MNQKLFLKSIVFVTSITMLSISHASNSDKAKPIQKSNNYLYEILPYNIPLATIQNNCKGQCATLINNNQTILLQDGKKIDYLQFFLNMQDNYGQGVCWLKQEDINSINQTFAKGNGINIVFDLTKNTSGKGYDFIYAVYDAVTLNRVCCNVSQSINNNKTGSFLPYNANKNWINAHFNCSYKYAKKQHIVKGIGMSSIPAKHPQAIQIALSGSNVTPLKPWSSYTTSTNNQTPINNNPWRNNL